MIDLSISFFVETAQVTSCFIITLIYLIGVSFVLSLPVISDSGERSIQAVLLCSPHPPNYLALLLRAPTQISRDSIMLLFLSLHLIFFLVQGNRRHPSLERIHSFNRWLPRNSRGPVLSVFIKNKISIMAKHRNHLNAQEQR